MISCFLRHLSEAEAFTTLDEALPYAAHRPARHHKKAEPAYFGGYIAKNFTAAFEALPQPGEREAYTLAADSFEEAFAPAADKARSTAELDRAFGR